MYFRCLADISLRKRISDPLLHNSADRKHQAFGYQMAAKSQLVRQRFNFAFCKTVFYYLYTGCPRRNGQNFRIVFLMLNYTDKTQNTYIQSWTVTEIMAIEKCGLLGCPRTVRRPWCHTRPVRMPGNETPLANIVMQWPWRDNGSAAVCVKYLET